MKKLFIRLFYGLLFALPIMLLTYAFAQAGNPPQAQQLQQQSTPLICPACHESTQKEWEQSAHGMAVSDPTFRNEWEAQGKPGECLTCHVTGYDPDKGTWLADGITCTACHNTTQANHPLQPITADRSSKLCGTCHQETYFEWQASVHRQNGVDCIACHDPHATSLKAEDAYSQCSSCHKERSTIFTHSQHSQSGLTCADCHMAVLSDPTEGHSGRDHTFTVRLSTCNTCHAYQMHDPAQVHAVDPTPSQPDALAAVESASVADVPNPVSPVGFATLAGVFGVAAGAILAPWLERLFRNRKQKSQDTGEDQEQ